jgi:hypothetical protein
MKDRKCSYLWGNHSIYPPEEATAVFCSSTIRFVDKDKDYVV